MNELRSRSRQLTPLLLVVDQPSPTEESSSVRLISPLSNDALTELGKRAPAHESDPQQEDESSDIKSNTTTDDNTGTSSIALTATTTTNTTTTQSPASSFASNHESLVMDLCIVDPNQPHPCSSPAINSDTTTSHTTKYTSTCLQSTGAQKKLAKTSSRKATPPVTKRTTNNKTSSKYHRDSSIRKRKPIKKHFDKQDWETLRYAFVVNDENKNIVQIIDKHTTNDQLKKVKSEIDKRRRKNDTDLIMYEVNPAIANNNTNTNETTSKSLASDHQEVGNIQLIRKLDEGEEIPSWFARCTKIKLTKKDVHEKALNLLKEIVIEFKRLDHPLLPLSDSTERRSNASSACTDNPKGLPIPPYLEPNGELLQIAYSTMAKFLPPQDVECFHSVQAANRYYEYFRPDKVRVILLAESHAYTDEALSKHGPIIGSDKLSTDDYSGPRDFVSLVYCLAYGESSILAHRDDDGDDDSISKAAALLGTTQFWKLFEACAGFAPNEDGSYGSKVLVKHVKDHNTRVRNKLEILLRLKQRGIWLLDTSIIGWYIPQPTEYNITMKSKKIHKLEKARPPAVMKEDTLLLSWELYIKHVVRKAALEGNLKLFIPIGKDVVKAITHSRFRDAAMDYSLHIVHDGIAAMNAQDDAKNKSLKERLQHVAEEIHKKIGPYDPSV